MPYAGATAPTGFLLCDGGAVSRTTYAGLFGTIGTVYGAGDGSTTFALPNMKGRVPTGLDAAQTEFDTRGETGGTKTHTLTSAEMPSHIHSLTFGSGGATGGADVGQYGSPNGGITGSAGGGGAHNNLQPYLVLNYIISY